MPATRAHYAFNADGTKDTLHSLITAAACFARPAKQAAAVSAAPAIYHYPPGAWALVSNLAPCDC
jgi:hypothetical protein